MSHMVYLASQSPSRKRLLKEAAIPFQVLAQSADEKACDWTLPLEQLVESIAIHKMDSLPINPEFENLIQAWGETCQMPIERVPTRWVLTTDTLGQDSQRRIYAKPLDHQDARAQIKAQRDQWVRVATAFCLDRKVFTNGSWQTEERFSQTVISEILFSIQDHEIDEYIVTVDALSCAGSISIDGFGGQYLKALNGSYSCVIGLPLFELRQALKKAKFFDN